MKNLNSSIRCSFFFKIVFNTAIVFILFVLILSRESSAQPALKNIQNPNYVEGELLVRFKKEITDFQKTELYRTHGIGESHSLHRHKDLYRLHLPRGQSLDAAMEAFKYDPRVESVQPNYIYRISGAPDDTNYSQQWGFNNTNQTISSPAYGTNNPPGPGFVGKDMNLNSAWNLHSDCSSVTVAVLDTGVNYNHADLNSNMANGSYSCPGSTTGTYGCNFVGAGGNDPMDYNGHGTHVAGIIGAVGNNNLGVSGVCQKSRILAVKVIGLNGGTTVDIIEGIAFAAANGAKVINMSFGNYSFDNAFYNEINSVASSGVMFVASAGNENNDNRLSPSYPCSYNSSNLLCVAALDQAYSLATFSNYDTSSASSRTVDVGAPGTNILSTWGGNSATIYDDFNTNSILDWTNSSGTGWAYSLCNYGTGATSLLINPTSWCSSHPLYAANLNDQVYKTFTVSGSSTFVGLAFWSWSSIGTGDTYKVFADGNAGNPFGTAAIDNITTSSGFYPYEYNLTSCTGKTICTVGFELKSDGSSQGYGIGISKFLVQTMNNSVSVYNTINGTSMASPAAAGVAALIRSYNPLYTCADTIQAIGLSGDSESALANKTKYGTAVDADRALKYIAPPQNLKLTQL